KGTGLGLSTVYGIVRQMGGDISVDSELGRGTSFCVVFPETQDDAEEVRLPEREPTPALGTETILVVEDDQAVRRVTVRILVGQGYKVLEASSPSEARRVLSEVQPVDLVI